MKVWKRLGTIAAAMLVVMAAMAGTALAAEPEAPAISVQLNGKMLAFSDAAPEASGERTFVPLRAVMEAMDAQVDYDRATDTVTIRRGGVDLSMVPGENRATVTEEGESRVLEMDVSPYVKNDRTYVPVRFVAESFGCAVGWDQRAKTVIIVDVDALLGDSAFTLMDSFSAYCSKQDRADNMTLSGTLDLEAKDKTGAYLTKPLSAQGSIDGVVGDKGAQLAWKLKLSGLSELLAETASPVEQALMEQMMEALSDLEGDVRLDLEKNVVYWSLPAELTGVSRDVWYSLDFSAYQAELLGALDMTKLTQLEDAGIREVLSAIFQNMPLNDSETSYAALAEIMDIYKALLSDQAFTQKGNTYVAQMRQEDMMDMTVTLTKRGNDIVSADIEMSCDVAEGSTRAVITMTEHAAPDKVTVDMAMSVEDEDMGMTLKLNLTGVSAGKAPVTAPPAGAEIIPMA